MQLRHAVVSLALAAFASAQNNSLPILPTGNAYLWGPPNTSTQVFLDMTVNTTITLQGLTYTGITPIGTPGSIEIWLTNPGTTTYVGNELNPGVWTQVASGPTAYPVTPNVPSVVFTAGAVITPGTYGVAVRYNNVDCLFYLGNGTNQTFANADLSVTCGATQSGAFTVTPFSPYVLFGTLYYGLGAVAHNAASKADYGAGCNASSGSYYQRFLSASATAAALNGRALTHTFTGTGYVVAPSVGITYIAPSASAVALPANNNLQTAITLPSAFSFPGGSTTQLHVSTNGYVTDVPMQAPPGALSYLPHEYGLLNGAATMWAVAFHDYNSAEVGSGLVKWEQVGNLIVVTWDGVESYPAPLLNPSVLQAQFDLVTGEVHYVWVTMDAVGGSPYHDQTVIGFSPGGPSPDVGPIDATTLTSLLLTTPEVLPLTLAASTPPVLGTTVDLTTSNEVGTNLGINFLSLTAIPAPGFDLGVIGAPGCRALVDTNVGVGNLIANLGAPLPGMVSSLPLPATAALAGTVVVSQSVWLDPTANAFGITASNATRLTLGLFGL